MDLSDVDLDFVNRKIGSRTEAMSVEEALLAFIAGRLASLESHLLATTDGPSLVGVLESIADQLSEETVLGPLGRNEQLTLRGDIERLIEMLNLGESDLDVSLAKMLDLRSGQAVIALREILDEIRLDERDELIESILDEAVEEGLLEQGEGLPEEWEAEDEGRCNVPVPPSERDSDKWLGASCEREKGHEGQHRATYGRGSTLAVREWREESPAEEPEPPEDGRVEMCGEPHPAEPIVCTRSKGHGSQHGSHLGMGETELARAPGRPTLIEWKQGGNR